MYSRVRFLVGLFLIFSFSTQAQKLGDLLKQAAKEAVNETATSEKMKMDSVDFQLAISINENAGFFDVKEKGEGLTQGLYVLGKDATTKTQAEMLRDSLETALGYYNARMYKFAELEIL